MRTNGNRLVVIMAVLALIASSAVGAAAYSSLTADRSTSIDVVSDANGVIQLSAGPSVFVDSTNGKLNIDLSRGSASGINVGSQLDIGKESAPKDESAFNVTNALSTTRQVTLEYNLTSDDGNSVTNVEFEVYNDTGTLEGTITEESSSESFTLASSGTYYVVMNVDTNGLETADDLSGTLSITLT